MTYSLPFVYGDKVIPFENSCKYLGVKITDSCKFNKAKKERVVKARKTMFVISFPLILHKLKIPLLMIPFIVSFHAVVDCRVLS